MKEMYEELQAWEKNEGRVLFEKMHWRKDAKVLDYGCGYGHYSIALARTLNEMGRVYAVDTNKACLKELQQKIESEGLKNIEVRQGHKKLLEEAGRVLKSNATLSVLPFHLSNFRDNEGNKKKYSYAQLIHEIEGYGYELIREESIEGINFEKCHSSYQLSKGKVELEGLERAEILNFMKL